MMNVSSIGVVIPDAEINRDKISLPDAPVHGATVQKHCVCVGFKNQKRFACIVLRRAVYRNPVDRTENENSPPYGFLPQWPANLSRILNAAPPSEVWIP